MKSRWLYLLLSVLLLLVLVAGIGYWCGGLRFGSPYVRLTFGSPYLLLFLLAVPAAIVGYWLLERRRRTHAAAWASSGLLPNMVSRPGALRLIPTILFLVGASFLLVGFARPEGRFTQTQAGATIVVAIDVSGSMAATDVKPSRLGAADAVVASFVKALPASYRVALLTFAQNYAIKVPPTFDHEEIIKALPTTTVYEGTAISDAIDGAIKAAVLSAGPPHGKVHGPPAAVLLLSDGGQNAGQLTAPQAATEAKRSGIPISTVALGTDGGSVTQHLKVNGSSKTSPVTTRVPADPATLQQLAVGSGGAFFQGPESAAGLSSVYKALSARLVHTPKQREVTGRVSGAALVLILIGAVFSGLWFRRVV